MSNEMNNSTANLKAVSIFLSLGCFSLLLSGCGVWSSWFGEEDLEEPAELVKFDEEVSIKREWKVNIGNGQGDKFNRLKPALSGDAIYAASTNGIVVSLNRETGQRNWRAKLDLDISGGVSATNGLILLGTEDAQVLALDDSSGEILWQVEVSSEVLATPVSDGDVVVVQSVDGKLTGLNADTGEQIWIYESTMPVLSLRGNSAPIIIDNYVVASFANGSVVSVALDNGTLRWDERVAIPTGRSDIDRLVDIDGELYLDGNGALLVSSYQGYFVALDPVTGQTRWRVAESSYGGAGSGFGNVYITDDRSHVKAYKTNQNSVVWENDQLNLRQVSAPLGFSNYIAVADFKGYVHLLSQVDGRFVGRIKVDGKGIRTGMLSQGNTLFVYGNSGDLVAMSVE